MPPVPKVNRISLSPQQESGGGKEEGYLLHTPSTRAASSLGKERSGDVIEGGKDLLLPYGLSWGTRKRVLLIS